jgi:hypothetical protein
MNISTDLNKSSIRQRGRPRLGHQQISFQLPPEMIQKLKDMAVSQGIKTSTLLQRILSGAL